MNLNVGCGEFPADGWVNIDLHADGPSPDLVASVTSLPFDDDSAERVYCGHVLEHLTLDDELPRALAEIRRVLHPDGVLLVVGPDLDRADSQHLVDLITTGGRRWAGDAHRWPSTEALTAEKVAAAGFDVSTIDVAMVSDDWPLVSRVGWQFALQARPLQDA